MIPTVFSPVEAVRVVSVGFEVIDDVNFRGEEKVIEFFNSSSGKDIFTKALLKCEGNCDHFISLKKMKIYDGYKREDFLAIKRFNDTDIHDYYFYRKGQQYVDLDILERIFLRKMALLTRKGKISISRVGDKKIEKESYITIQLDDFNVDFYKPSPSYQQHPGGTNEFIIMMKKIYEYGCKIQLFLHLENRELIDGQNDLSIPANLSCVIRVNGGDEEHYAYVLDFSEQNLKSVYLKLGDAVRIIQNGVDRCVGDEAASMESQTNAENRARDSAIDWIVQDEEKGEYVDLYTFLVMYAWIVIAEPIRKYLVNEKTITETKGDESYEGTKFVNSIRERFNELFYESLSLNLNKDDYDSFIDVLDEIGYGKSKPSLSYQTREIVEDIISEYFTISKKGSCGGEFQSEFRNGFKEYFKVDHEYALYNDNKRLWFGNIDLEASKKHIREGNIMYDAAWAVVLSDFLTTTAQVFLSYNDRIEEHVKEGRRFKELRELTKRSIEDFKEYYEVGVVKTWLMDTYAKAKDEFHINDYYKILKEKLDMFSEYEIASAGHFRSNLVSYGSIIGAEILIITLAFTEYQVEKNWLYSLISFISFTGIVIAFLGYYSLRKRE